MRFRATGILLALAAALGAYVVFVDQPSEDRRRARERVEGALLDFSREDVQALEIPLEEGGRARVERVGRARDGALVWQLVDPIRAPAEAPAVNGLLTGFERMRAEDEIDPPPDDLARYGFDPEQRVRVEPDRGEAIWIALGDDTPVANQRYVWLDGRRSGVFLVDKPQTAGLSISLQQLRDKRMVDVDPKRVREVRVDVDGALRVRAERVDAGGMEEGIPVEPRWALLEPIEEEADHNRLARLVQELYFARAEGFVDRPGALETYGLAPPAAAVELRAEGELLARAELGRAGERAYLRLAGAEEGAPVYVVATRLFEAATADLFAYRFKRVLTIPERGVRRMELLFPRAGARFELVRPADDADWTPVGEDWELREELAPDDLLFQLYQLDAVGRIASRAPATLGLEPPLLRVTLSTESEAVGWIEFGAPEEGQGVPVRSSQSERLWWAAPELALAAPLGLDVFRARWERAEPVAPADARPAGGTD